MNHEVLFLSAYDKAKSDAAVIQKKLVNTVNNHFRNTQLKVCALEDHESGKTLYPEEVLYRLNTSSFEAYLDLADRINNNENIAGLHVCHEFDFYKGSYSEHLLYLLYSVSKPVFISFNEVVAAPDPERKQVVKAIGDAAVHLFVNDETKKTLLHLHYELPENKITVVSQTESTPDFSDYEKASNTVGNNVADITRALLHVNTYNVFLADNARFKYKVPEIDTTLLNKLTSNEGLVRSTDTRGDGYLLDDQALGLLVFAHLFQYYKDEKYLKMIGKELDFISHCQRKSSGRFLNFVDEDGNFSLLNDPAHMDFSNGKAIDAVAYMLRKGKQFSERSIKKAHGIFELALPWIEQEDALILTAFGLKAYCDYYNTFKTFENRAKLFTLADKLLNKIAFGVDIDKEQHLWMATDGAPVIPASILMAFVCTGENKYKIVAQTVVNTFIKQVFDNDILRIPEGIQKNPALFVSDVIQALRLFYDVLNEPLYKNKMQQAFNWFLGSNRYHQMIYDESDGRCFEIQKGKVLSQKSSRGTLCYLLSRLSIDQYLTEDDNKKRVRVFKKKKVYSTMYYNSLKSKSKRKEMMPVGRH